MALVDWLDVAIGVKIAKYSMKPILVMWFGGGCVPIDYSTLDNTTSELHNIIIVDGYSRYTCCGPPGRELHNMTMPSIARSW